MAKSAVSNFESGAFNHSATLPIELQILTQNKILQRVNLILRSATVLAEFDQNRSKPPGNNAICEPGQQVDT
jgi:hypothetical protein